MSENIRRILANVDLRSTFITKINEVDSHERHKDKIAGDEQAGVIYVIGCKDCGNIYVGETARTAKLRAKEHNMHVRTGNTHLSAVAAHTNLRREIY